jgi:poly(A) polymerase
MAFEEMEKNVILFQIIPEFVLMQGVEQPLFHHLDVLHHSLQAIFKVEELIETPEERFEYPVMIQKWLENKSNLISIKWAALLHDLGKPDCKKIRNNNKITFYKHDIHGSKMCNMIGRRLRWPVHRIHLVSSLVRYHMRPFHLLNTLKFGGPTKRALRRLLKEISIDYPGLFLLAMADEMAGCGPLKPVDLHIKLSRVWKVVHEFYVENEDILSRGKRFLNGKDIQKILSVSPGPFVGKAINALEEAQVLGLIHTKQEAIDWLTNWHEKRVISFG